MADEMNEQVSGEALKQELRENPTVALIPALFDGRPTIAIVKAKGGFMVQCGADQYVATTKRQLLAILRELL